MYFSDFIFCCLDPGQTERWKSKDAAENARTTIDWLIDRLIEMIKMSLLHSG